MTGEPGEKEGKSLSRQWIKFNAVGAMGIVVQLAALSILTHGVRMNYMAATFFAVEAAVLHNFLWHEKWTWAHRAYGGVKDALFRLLKFNLTTGALSIAGNLLFMRVFVGTFRFPVVIANIVTIALCSLLNFAVSEWFVFRSHRLQQ